MLIQVGLDPDWGTMVNIIFITPALLKSIIHFWHQLVHIVIVKDIELVCYVYSFSAL